MCVCLYLCVCVRVAFYSRLRAHMRALICVHACLSVRAQVSPLIMPLASYVFQEPTQKLEMTFDEFADGILEAEAGGFKLYLQQVCAAVLVSVRW